MPSTLCIEIEDSLIKHNTIMTLWYNRPTILLKKILLEA